MKRHGRVSLGIALAAVIAAAQADERAYEWRLPRGFPEPAVPADNPMNPAKVALGARLFADTRLSVTGEYSCASCHDPARAFTDGRAQSRGATGATLSLNAPSLLNTAYNASFGWHESGVTTLEAQMRGPLFNEEPPELGLAGRDAQVERALRADAEARDGFAAAFPDGGVTMDNAIRAIAAYERTLIAASSPFDRYVFAGDHDALSPVQKRGMDIFFSSRGGCAQCHGGINFAGDWLDRDHRDTRASFADVGTGGAARVPTLRNLTMTAPFMHDGRFATLEQVLDHYENLAADPHADPRLRRPQLTSEERSDLLAFVRSLSEQPGPPPATYREESSIYIPDIGPTNGSVTSR